ncbi:MAG TPA: HlyC/CorC family transporter [Leptolyngbyaceae cyanobacterium M33_DOE_097]|uniref:HlyC/CorC family transporter n=1 Tax=Oscillatoriales cyanobacterium SpSt-418 TaxID=2282169 RepID=A0A7C3KDW4_9CYAN|nr:HlyC/CorC family transporter [Leptolyngbyaceae cyanobacterium M33_DOE_097]
MNIAYELLFIFLLILVNAFFAATEIALVSASDVRMKLLAEEGNRRALLVLNTTQNGTRFLATIQVGITLAAFFTSALAATNLSEPLANWMQPQLGGAASVIAFILVTSVISFISLVLGELVPKRLAIRHAEDWALASVQVIRWLGILTAPIVKLLSFCTDSVLRLLGTSTEEVEERVSSEEIMAMVDASMAGGVVGEQERRIIHRAVEIRHIPARAIMVPRVQIQYLKITTTLEEAYKVVAENAHTRLPVCDGDLDNIVGVLHVKDLIRPMPDLMEQPPSLRELLRPVRYVPEGKLVAEMLEEMKRDRLHMLIVRDEFGGTAGLVTLEDVLEELVGEIRDEYDLEEEREFRRISDHEGIFKIRASLAAVNNELDLELPRDEAATLAGLFLEELHRPPEVGDRLQIDNVLLEVLEDGQRVRVSLAPPPETEADA